MDAYNAEESEVRRVCIFTHLANPCFVPDFPKSPITKTTTTIVKLRKLYDYTLKIFIDVMNDESLQQWVWLVLFQTIRIH